MSTYSLPNIPHSHYFIRQFHAYNKAVPILQLPKPVLVAVSGGVDSMVLALVLHTLQVPIAIAHVNYGLRGVDSIADHDLVQSLATRLSIPFHTISPDVAAYKSAHQLSTQMAARELRHSFFQELLQQYQYTCIATAHHLDDEAETLLLNFSSGALITGLQGFHHFLDPYWKPLLFATKEQVRAFAEEFKITFREDKSNLSDQYKRNFIRHNIVPPLVEAINPSVTQTLHSSAEARKGMVKVLNFTKDLLWKQLAKPMVDALVLRKQDIPEALNAQAIALTVSHLNLPIAALNELARNLMLKVLRTQFPSSTLCLYSELDGLILRHATATPEHSITLAQAVAGDASWAPIHFSCSESSMSKAKISPAHFPYSAALGRTLRFRGSPDLYLPLDFPLDSLQLRPWNAGDSMRPLGLKGKKTIGNLLTDAKISTLERELLPIVVDADDTIIWVPGIARSEHLAPKLEEGQALLKISFSWIASFSNSFPTL